MGSSTVQGFRGGNFTQVDDFPSGPNHSALKQPSLQILALEPTALLRCQIPPDMSFKAYATPKVSKRKVKPWYKIFHSNLGPNHIWKYLGYHLHLKFQENLKHTTQMVKTNTHHAHSKLDIPQEDTYKDDEVDTTQEWGESRERGGNRGAFPK